MHLRTTALAGGLVAALAACSDQGSTPVAPEDAPARRLTYPAVTVYCNPDHIWCDATASGGSGDGYSFEWSYNIDEQSDGDGYSWGYINCHGYIGWTSVSVTVTDSYNQAGGGSAYIYCQP